MEDYSKVDTDLAVLEELIRSEERDRGGLSSSYASACKPVFPGP